MTDAIDPELLGMFRSAAGAAKYFAAYEETLTHWPAPPERRDVETPWGRTHVLSVGPADAPPLVLLHGFGYSSTVWHPNVGAWMGMRRVHALDVPGQPSRTTVRQRPKRHADMSAWLGAALDALGVARADFVGVSYGAWLAMRFGVAAPERVRSLTAIAPASTLLRIRLPFYARGAVVSLLPCRPTVRWFVRWIAQMEHREPFDEPSVRQFLAGLRHYKARPPAIPNLLSDEELRSLRMPVQVIVGDREVIYPPADALARAKRLLPAADVRLIPGASHAASITHAEAVNGAVGEWLAGCGPS